LRFGYRNIDERDLHHLFLAIQFNRQPKRGARARLSGLACNAVLTIKAFTASRQKEGMSPLRRIRLSYSYQVAVLECPVR
jgi:hypothetical protein